MAEQGIFKALTSIMNEVDAIGKNKRNQQQGFAYRGIDDMYNELQPKFAKYKVFIASEVLETQREERVNKNGTLLIYTILKVRFTFYTEDGSSVSSVTIGEAMDSGDKGANKAMSVALKYCLMQLLLIPTEELKKEDPDGQVHHVQPTQKVSEEWNTKVDNCTTQKELVELYQKNKAEVDANPLLQQLISNRRNQINNSSVRKS